MTTLPDILSTRQGKDAASWTPENARTFFTALEDYLGARLHAKVPACSQAGCCAYLRDKRFDVLRTGQPSGQAAPANYAMYEHNSIQLDAVRRELIEIEDIAFPHWECSHKPDFNNLFTPFERMRFSHCGFYSNSIATGGECEYPQTINYLQFEDCVFEVLFKPDFLPRSAQYDSLFLECYFKAGVAIRRVPLWENFGVVFGRCSITSLHIEGVHLENRLFKQSGEKLLKLSAIYIYDSQLDRPLHIQYATLSHVDIKRSRLHAPVRFEDCKIDKLEIVESCFESTASFNCTFVQFLMNSGVDYKGFAEFVGARLGDETDPNPDAGVAFEQVTFHQLANFRNTKFLQKLDLRNSSFRETPTFLDAKFIGKAETATDRETFRIIKNAFQVVGNRIETDRVYALEMNAYRRELSCGHKRNAEWFLVSLNGLLSNHGQSYLRPLVAAVVGCGVVATCRYFGPGLWLHMPKTLQQSLTAVNDIGNYVATSVAIFHPIISHFPGFEFLSVTAAVFFSTCVWHFLVAARRHRKR